MDTEPDLQGMRPQDVTGFIPAWVSPEWDSFLEGGPHCEEDLPLPEVL